jgi:hypothetical protein
MTIFRIEPLDRFLHRVVELNRLHNHDDPLHDAIVGTPRANGDVRRATRAPAGAAARKALAGIHREFPFGAPVHEQAAYLLRAFCGLAVFSEGNFRTGWDYAGELLAHHGHSVEATLRESQDLGAALWDRLSATYPNGMGRTALLDRDDTLDWLGEWLHDRIAVAPKPS